MKTNSWESMMSGSDDGSSAKWSDGSVDGRFEEDSENDGLFGRSDNLYFSDDSMDMPDYWGSDRHRGRRRHHSREESKDEEDAEDEESDEEEDDKFPNEENDEEEEDEGNEDSVEVFEPQHNVDVIQLDDSSEEQPQGSSEEEYQGSSEEYKGSSEEEKEDSKAAEVIELSKDDKPDRPHFTVEVKRRNIGTNNGVRVPTVFARMYIPHSTSRIKTMTLRTNLPEAGPREYTVDYKFEKHKKCRVELGHGWQRFQIVNDLEVGTRLTFILQDQKRQRYDVDIERPDNSAEI